MRLTPLEPWIAAKIACPPDALSRERIEAYQVQKINEVLRLSSEKSSFYRQKLAGFPESIQNLQEFTTFPFTTEDDLRRDGLRMVCVSQGEIARVVTLDTSGTTGEPKRCYYTLTDQELTVDFFGVGMTTLVNAQDLVLILLPTVRPGCVGDLLHAGLARQGISSIPHGPFTDAAAVMRLINTEKVTSLVSSPSQALALARSGIASDHPMHSVLLSTDSVPRAVVRSLENAWGVEVFNHYGMTEMGLGGGVTCEMQRGYHLREADLYFEIVDPVTGVALPAGETGEVVFTTLTRTGMPLIRYRTGDISRFLPGECPCGTRLKSLQIIHDRLGSGVRFGKNLLELSELDEALFAMQGVNDFTAAVTPGSGSTADILSIRLYITDARYDLQQKALQLISQIPTVYIALDNRLGLVDLEISVGYPPNFGTLRKRKILICENQS